MESSTIIFHSCCIRLTWPYLRLAFKLVISCDATMALAEFSHPLQCSVLEPQINFPFVYHKIVAYLDVVKETKVNCKILLFLLQAVPSEAFYRFVCHECAGVIYLHEVEIFVVKTSSQNVILNTVFYRYMTHSMLPCI